MNTLIRAACAAACYAVCAALTPTTALGQDGEGLGGPPFSSDYANDVVAASEAESRGRQRDPRRRTRRPASRAGSLEAAFRRANPGPEALRRSLVGALEGHPSDIDHALEWIASPLGRALARNGRDTVGRLTQAHRDAIQRTGVGTHYGNQSEYRFLSPRERRAWVQRQALPDTQPPEPRRSSCIGWALEVLGEAYRAAGLEDHWAGIVRRVAQKGSKGTDLAKELERDGWQAVYFNPDTRVADDGSAEHTYTARLARTGRPYYGLQTSPDRQVIDYRPATGSKTPPSTAGLDRLGKVPFWFGLARGGTHTFVGRGRTVNEFHWQAMPNDPNAIEETDLAEFDWLSGVLMVPPGSWPKPPKGAEE